MNLIYKYVFRVRWQVIAFAGIVLAVVMVLDGCTGRTSKAADIQQKQATKAILDAQLGNADEAIRNYTVGSQQKPKPVYH